MTPEERAAALTDLRTLADSLRVGPPTPSPPTHSAWGTPVDLIDGDEYCLSCERDNREGHYENCTLFPPSEWTR